MERYDDGGGKREKPEEGDSGVEPDRNFTFNHEGTKRKTTAKDAKRVF
ncbi:MAG: hypothetical protein LBQ88_10600 [Treponema sp.]|jgi:hypothetical protein|nr:hypothetical protein [Treponema sp.]